MPTNPPSPTLSATHDAGGEATSALNRLAEYVEALDTEEAAEVLRTVFGPPGAAHALVRVLDRFSHWAADAHEAPEVYEPLIREAAELRVNAYRITAVANTVEELPSRSPRASAALAASPAALASGRPLHTVAAAAPHVPPRPRITEPPHR
ncbi:hypothetical protein KNE206_53430 [Kitasatospora sp. NE20-6]|uniref:hypothetical protein n=1 Tax=Kitasatospora sp. NE20-6 TaxID=2859066 RepID=UPI0034DC7D7C